MFQGSTWIRSRRLTSLRFPYIPMLSHNKHYLSTVSRSALKHAQVIIPFETPPAFRHRTVTPQIHKLIICVFKLHTALTRYDPIDEVEELFLRGSQCQLNMRFCSLYTIVFL